MKSELNFQFKKFFIFELFDHEIILKLDFLLRLKIKLNVQEDLY